MSETRALSAALSGPTFEGAASRSALHASERHVERWAPEGPSAARSRGLRSLAFADRVASPWMSTSMMGARTNSMFSGGHQERSAPGVSWVFPRPWFQDELDWMAASRQAAESSPQFLTTRGTYASARTSPSDVSMPMIAPELVVPSMMAASMGYGSSAMAAQRPASAPAMPGLVAGMAPAAAAMQHGLRAWSPSVPFAAAAAAEVMAGAVSVAASSGLASVAERSPLLAGLTMVSPASLSGQASSASRPSSALDASTAAIARIEQGRRESSPTVAAQSAAVTAAMAASEASSPGASSSSSSSSAPVVALSSDELAMSSTIGASPSMSGALRAIELLVHSAASASADARSSSSAASSSSPSSSSSAPTSTFASATPWASSSAGPSSAGLASAPGFSASPASWSSIAEPVSSTAATRSTSTLSPVVGPRVALPAGLGGLAAALETAQTVGNPMARSAAPAPFARAAAAGLAAAAGVSSAAGFATSSSSSSATVGGAPEPASAGTPGFRSFAPVWAAPATALAAVAGDRARGVDHLAWSDRWLARFAGASPVALAALDVSRGEVDTTPRLLSAQAPEQVYLHPQMAPARLRAALDASSPTFAGSGAAAAAPASRPTGVLRIDDGESVPDAIFAAIAAATSPSRAPAPRAARTAEAAPAPALAPQSMADAVRRGSRPTAADLVSISAPVAPDAGLSAGLASSPMAAAMGGVLPLPAAPVFDTRALYASGMATAYLGGLTARAAAPVGVLASAPSAMAMASVARFGDVAATGGAMAGWSLRDLSLAPMALRLAEQAPERPMVATGGDVDVVLRRGGMIDRSAALASAAPTWTSPVRLGAGRFDPAAVDQVMVAPSGLTSTRTSPTTAASTGAVAAPASITGPTGPLAATGSPSSADSSSAASSSPSLSSMAIGAEPVPAIEPELLALRSALLASPTAAAAPLAHSASPLMLSAAMSVPSAASAWAEPTEAGAPARFAQPLLTLPSIGAQAPSPVATALASHAATGAFVPPALAAAGAASAAAADPSSPSLRSSGRPGAFAEQALRWSVAEERSAANLSFDFVSPEMVLAARVYGLSPASAAEATRLAVAGPSALASLAGSLDLTFLRSFQQVAAGASAAAGPQSAVAAGGSGALGSPLAAGTGAPISAAAVRASSVDVATGAASELAPGASAELAASSSAVASASGPTFGAATSAVGTPSQALGTTSPSLGAWDASSAAGTGVASAPIAGPHAAARMPRGAFLWPAGAVNALGLRAQPSDGVSGLPVVALELLAAQAVADLGTWVSSFPGAAMTAGAEQVALVGALRAAGLPVPPALAALTQAPVASSAMTPVGAAPSVGATSSIDASAAATGASAAATGASAAATSATSAEAAAAFDDSIGALPEVSSPAALRSRFEAVYIAMSRSPEGMSLSPSARAARAMAVVAGSEAGALSPRARAAAVWSVMPQVFQGDLDMIAPARAAVSDETPGWNARPNMVGLAGLASRAGEALGSFVSPQASELATAGGGATATERTATPLADRVENPVYVDTARPDAATPASSVAAAMRRPGRTFSQVGGGEPEIPAWFEGAARKMLEGRSGDSGGVSLAEMVLVNAVSPKQIAASTKSANAGGGQAQSKGPKGDEQQPDVGKLAHEVYAEVLKLIDAARERGGDPYQ